LSISVGRQRCFSPQDLLLAGYQVRPESLV
jgi:hypothetical protein